MILEIPRGSILELLIRQLRSHFLLTAEEVTAVGRSVDAALARCENNFMHSENKYFTRWSEGGVKNLTSIRIIRYST